MTSTSTSNRIRIAILAAVILVTAMSPVGGLVDGTDAADAASTCRSRPTLC